MYSFVALYRGATLGSAKIVAVSTDPNLVAQVAARLLSESPVPNDSPADPAIRALEVGRRRALRIIQGGKDD